MYSPKISIIVPTLNMVCYIENTIQSILNQSYDNLELIIIDGGSTDGTLKLLEKYANHFSFYLTEPDEGMYHAITKGIDLSSGNIIAWLNADDVYFPWTLSTVARVFSENSKIEWLCGVPAFISENGSLKKIYNNISAKSQTAISNGWFRKNGFGYLQQESMFWRRELYRKAGGLDLQYKYAADFELWTKFARWAELWSINLPLAGFRLRKTSLSKKYECKYKDEVEIICRKFKSLPIPLLFFGKIRVLNWIVRLLTIKRTKIIHQPMSSELLIYEERYRSHSSLTISQLLLEISKNKIDIKLL